jgi:ribonuclease J
LVNIVCCSKTGLQTPLTNSINKNKMDRTNNNNRRNFQTNNRHQGQEQGNDIRRKGMKLDRRPRSAPRQMRKKFEKENEIPEIGNNIRIIPLGGVEEVGKNMTAIEVGNDIIIIDAGFQFKDETTPGIDYILPNTKYLEERKDKIRAMFITHGHLDHIGGIPYIINKIGNPKIYSRQFGAIMIQKRQEEFPHLPKIDITILDGDETVPIGENIKVETFAISHTIPDAMGLIIHTPMGKIVFIEDVRVDNMAGVPTDEEVAQYKRFKDKDVLLLTMDSTSVEKPGWSLSETVVIENIDRIMKDVTGRLIIGTFASQVERILAIINSAAKYGKKVVVEGRSMKSNVEIIKYLNLVKTDNLINLNEIENFPPDKIVLLVTGAQGEEFAALMRMANKSHKYVTLRKTDTILLSSSIIPTNHSAVVRLKDQLYRSEAKVITYLDTDVHASGHGNREELGWIHKQINYKYFIPLHGNHYMLRQHAELCTALGTPEENVIVPDNGSIIEISDNGNQIKKLDVKAPNEIVTVDGFAVSDIQDVVIRDRQLLSEAGIFMIVASINTRTGRLKKSPDIISRGFVYLRESQDLLSESRELIRRIIERNIRGKSQIDFEFLKKKVSDELTKFLFQKTAKQPLVIPVILGV